MTVTSITQGDTTINDESVATKPKLVFCIGDSRTGTTSFHEHSEQLGFSSIHHYNYIFGDGNGDGVKSPRTSETIFRFIRESGHECFSDYPTRSFYRELAEEFPHARFVHTVRSLESWLASCRKYFGNAGITIDYTKLTESHVRIESEIATFFTGSDRYLRINICEDDPAVTSKSLNTFLLGHDPGLVIGKANQGAHSYFGGVYNSSDWNPSFPKPTDVPTHRLVPSRDQFRLYNFSVRSLDELMTCIVRRQQKAILSERGHAFLANDASGGFAGIVLGNLDRAERKLAFFEERRTTLKAQGCSYTVFIVPEKVTLATRLLPNCFDPFMERVAANIATKRLAHHISSRLGFVYDLAPYCDSLNEASNLLFRYDSHLNYLGAYYVAMVMSEILSATLPGAIAPIPRGIWSCKVGTWKGDLLPHLDDAERSLACHAWRRNSNLLALGPQCPPPNEQFLHYFIPDSKQHLTHEIDPILQALHPAREQSKYSRVKRSDPDNETTLLFVHDSSIDKIFEPLSMMADTSFFYWNGHHLPPTSHVSLRSGSNVVEVIAERFLYV